MITTVPEGFLPGLQHLADRVEVVAIASRTRSTAEQVAHDFAIPAVYDDLAQMLDRADLDAVLNATPGPVHHATSREILAAGKHLVTDKPLASTMAEADELCALARTNGLLIVSAPDDLLGQEWQEARRLVGAGAIGRPAFARVQSSHAGPAGMAWPRDPTWFYQRGAGPLLDMGVYGIDRITGILGPARRVSAMSGLVEPVRRVRGGPYDGQEIQAEEDDNVVMLLDFGGSTFATLDATFNVVATKSPLVEIFGTEGTLVVHRPDASLPPGHLPLELSRLGAAAGAASWTSPRARTPEPAVGIARARLVEHLVDCLETGTAPVTSGERARHVLEVMLGAQRSAREDRVVELETVFG
jgi:predicted dehydrogenase